MFSDIFESFNFPDIKEEIYSATESDVTKAIAADTHNFDSICPLFSPAADKFLEDIALRSRDITRQRFGNVIQLYAPLYISNECTNRCAYCGFNSENRINRATLTMEQVLEEANILYRSGFRHILLLTGEDKNAAGVDYIADIAKNLRKKFSYISIEVYPMEIDEYKILNLAGVDGLTIYQETYDRETYAEVHRGGRKRDFIWRLNTPDRGGIAGLRRLGIGSLLGLYDWRVDAYITACHGLYLAKRYWKSQVQVSFPRLRGAAGGFKPEHPVSDRDFTHLICAMRIILPDAGLVISTREPAGLRDNLLPLGITQMSAGSSTAPGGYAHKISAEGQFEVMDSRSPSEISALISNKGFDPVWKDWDNGI